MSYISVGNTSPLEEEMDVVFKGKAALIIVNWDYDGMDKLEFPESDGNMMKDMMTDSDFDKVKVVKITKNIFAEIEHFVEDMNNKSFERFHFHYSGKTKWDKNMFVSNYLNFPRSWSLQCEC